MSPEEHLLLKLAEECGEVGKEVSKALLFGLNDRITYDPEGRRGNEGMTCREKIIDELNDLMGVIEALMRVGILPCTWKDVAKQQSRPLRLARFMMYAVRAKTCDPPSAEWLSALTELNPLPRGHARERPVSETDVCHACQYLKRPNQSEVWASCTKQFPGLFDRGICRVCPEFRHLADPA